eukprot:253329-Rhodomonas_salina.1
MMMIPCRVRICPLHPFRVVVETSVQFGGLVGTALSNIWLNNAGVLNTVPQFVSIAAFVPMARLRRKKGC